MFLGPAIWINCLANFEYISVRTIDLLGSGKQIKSFGNYKSLFLFGSVKKYKKLI